MPPDHGNRTQGADCKRANRQPLLFVRRRKAARAPQIPVGLLKKLDGNFPEFNFQEFPHDAPVDSIADAVVAMPFMAERKCVTVSDLNVEAMNTAELDKLYELLDGHLRNRPVLILYLPTLEIDPKKERKVAHVFKEARHARLFPALAAPERQRARKIRLPRGREGKLPSLPEACRTHRAVRRQRLKRPHKRSDKALRLCGRRRDYRRAGGKNNHEKHGNNRVSLEQCPRARRLQQSICAA